MNIFDDYNVLYNIIDNLSLIDIFRFKIINTTFYNVITDLEKTKWENDINSPACKCMIILKTDFHILNIKNYKQYMKESKWKAITDLFNKYYFVFLIDNNIHNCFINLILDKKSFIYNLFIIEKWYLNKELKKMKYCLSKYYNPKKYNNNQLKILQMFLNL